MASLTPESAPDLGDDLLDGATEIAAFMFKDPGKRRRVYYLNKQGALPLFYLAGALCGRKSTLTRHIEEAERAALTAAPSIDTDTAAAA